MNKQLSIPPRLILFIDRQNLYKNAREAFFSCPPRPHYYGQVNPVKLAHLVCQRDKCPSAHVVEVRVYCGRPDGNRDPKTYKAHKKQHSAWENWGATVTTRPLKYPPNWPNVKCQEKGIDVAIAIDFVTFAVDNKYDIGIIASTDSDLAPALEFVYSHKPNIRIAVASWRSPVFNKRISVKGVNIFCHYLGADDYQAVADLTRYSDPS